MNEWVLPLLAGIAAGSIGFFVFQRIKLGAFHSIADNVLQQAEKQAAEIRQNGEFELKKKQFEMQKELEETLNKEKRSIAQEEDRLKLREDKLESRLNLVEKKLIDIEKKEALLAHKKTEMEVEKSRLNEEAAKLQSSLENLSNLSKEEAKSLLLEKLDHELLAEKARKIQTVQNEIANEADRLASRAIVTAIQRLGSTTVSEATVSTVSLPSDELKGRIIGREGRNIRALEKATGASFLMDDTPQTVVISCFDPVRRAIAKEALTDLILDGRIHPTKIEEAVDKAGKMIERQILQFGQDAALRAGAFQIHPEIITLLGKLKFRYSLGQNVLEHSLEVSHLMGIMAGELGLDVQLARRIGLLHDMGKAVTHEVQGTHALIGRDLAQKYGESAQVANGIGCHHQEIEAITLEGKLCSAADAISASRPGARIDAVEEYVQRLYKLEEIAASFPGIDRAYALQAGREIRIMVKPEDIEDSALLPLAREITKKIESELVYPGKIKVSLFREKRVVDYAM